MKRKRSRERKNPVNASAIGGNANRTSDASLKDNEKTAHVETMQPLQDPQCRKEELTVALGVRCKFSMEPF